MNILLLRLCEPCARQQVLSLCCAVSGHPVAASRGIVQHLGAAEVILSGCSHGTAAAAQ